MTDLASFLSAFLNEHLPRERGASPHTCQSYAYSFQLLVGFAAQRHGVKPSSLQLDHLGVATVLAFLDYLEATRGCTARKLNAALWTAKTVAEGGTGDLFYTMNKEAAGDDLGLTLQTGFVTKALAGLFGSDRFRLAVSADGSTFFDGLS